MHSKLQSFDARQQQGEQGRIILFALAGMAAIAIGAAAVWFFTCPCERMPGAYLTGEQIEAPVADWGFANEVQLCQIQTRSGILPHAINLNCMADSNGRLFLSCSQCEGKRWSTAALQNPSARIRLDGLVYPVNLRRLQDPAELDNAWQARTLKLSGSSGDGAGELPQRPGHWWSFQVTSRS